MIGTYLIRAGRICIEAATGALIWRKPDPTSKPSLWRRAFVSIMVRVGSALARLGASLPV